MAWRQFRPGGFDPKNATLPSSPPGSRFPTPAIAEGGPSSFASTKHEHRGGALLGLSQWEGEKEGTPVGGARGMNAAAQTAGQLLWIDRAP
jgi:hypothetical protein